MPHYVNVSGQRVVAANPTIVHAVIETTEPDQYGTAEVLAPREFIVKWPTINTWFGDWRAVPGPARLLTVAEWKAVVGWAAR